MCCGVGWLMHSVLYVLWRGFFVDSVLYVLLRSFFNGQYYLRVLVLVC